MTPGSAQRAADRPGRETIGLIGAGRVGAPLAAALGRAGHLVVAAAARSPASRARVAALLPGVPVRPVPPVAGAGSLLLLAVPDDALTDLVHRLADADAVRPGTLVVHTSGRFGVAVLAPLTAAGALPLAVHPVMTFTGTAADVDRLAGAAFGVTSPDPLRPVAEALVIEVGGDPVWVAEADRPLYHAALAHAANHLVTLVAGAADLLRQAGVARPRRLLGPLLAATLQGVLGAGDRALTGPVARADRGTVAAHLAALTAAAPEVVPVYLALARHTAARAVADGRLTPADAAAVLDVLAGQAAPA